MVLGVDLGGTQIRAGVYKEGNIVERNQCLLVDKENFESTISQLKSVLNPLIKPNTKGIGIGVPSVVDVDKGVVYNVVNIASWKEVHLKAILQEEYGIPVHVNNDANCFTYGVYSQQKFINVKNLIGVTLGTGIGTGLVINGQPYFGRNCGAGELGMLPYNGKSYESYGSSQFFEFEYNTSAKELYQLALQGNNEAIASWHTYGYHLAQYVKVVLAAYDPDVIVFGGSITKAFNFFSSSLSDSLKDFEFPASIEHTHFLQNKNEHVALVGAAELLKNYSL